MYGCTDHDLPPEFCHGHVKTLASEHYVEYCSYLNFTRSFRLAAIHSITLQINQNEAIFEEFKLKKVISLTASTNLSPFTILFDGPAGLQ